MFFLAGFPFLKEKERNSSTDFLMAIYLGSDDYTNLVLDGAEFID